jgi:hypothetical protein
MSDLKFRPRFRIETSLNVREAEARLLAKLRTANHEGFESAIVQGHMILSIAREKRHFWSPQLDISIAPHEEGANTIIRCLLAPAPTAWTMFMFFYALAGFAALVGLMIGASQYTLNKTAWGFGVAAGSVFLGLALFFIAQIGKSVSKEEMQLLKAFVEEEEWPGLS